jgi:hypothetical protein
MPDQWFYARDANKLGPFTPEQFKELAVAGEIRPTDTVWKAGIDKGVLAAKVKNLLPPPPDDVSAPPEPAAIPPSLYVTPAPQMIPDPPIPSELPPPSAEVSKTSKASTSGVLPPRKGRATAILGAIIVGQDGHYVQFVKQCTVCGHSDRNKSRLPIKQGTTRIGFFCPKCRKLRQVQIYGIL